MVMASKAGKENVVPLGLAGKMGEHRDCYDREFERRKFQSHTHKIAIAI